MTKIYTLLPSEAEEDQKTIVITEEVTETKIDEEKVTIAQLKEKHSGYLEKLDNLKKEINEIISKLEEIGKMDNVTLDIKDIPIKLAVDLETK